MSDNPAKAYIQPNTAFGGVKLALSFNPGAIVVWPSRSLTQRVIQEHEMARDDEWVNIPDSAARALYEALAEYFGHGTNDVRALRRDYEAERGRVDKFIDHTLFLMGRQAPGNFRAT